MQRKTRWWWSNTKLDLWLQKVHSLSFEYLYRSELLKKMPEYNEMPTKLMANLEELEIMLKGFVELDHFTEDKKRA